MKITKFHYVTFLSRDKPDEALIKIRKAGICSTDLELVKGYYPYTGVIGHEFVGEVVSSHLPQGEGDLAGSGKGG